jgi:hypothetical protein
MYDLGKTIDILDDVVSYTKQGQALFLLGQPYDGVSQTARGRKNADADVLLL